MPRSKDHPLRREMSQIMHERTLPALTAPVSLRSWLYLVEDDEREDERQWIERLDVKATGASEQGRLLSLGARSGQVWECHGEFSTWLWFEAGQRDQLGFNQLDSNDFPWLKSAPGAVFRSVEISVQTEMPDLDALGAFIDLRQSVCCDVFGGAARIWTDFKLHGPEDDKAAGGEIEPEEGDDQPAQRTRSGRIFIHDQGLRNDELSRLLQTLIEIGHYRKLALLGFPVARDLIGWLKGAEVRLVGITESMAAQDATQQVVLEQLLALSAEVEHRINASRFRQGATEAYYRLTLDRLNALREQRVEGFATMADFVERRLLPAVRTCESASRRLDDLSLRISRASDLLRAKISISLDTQNQALLESMNLRAGLQMKMQALVEGLSVFALSYYIFNLFSAILNPLMGGGGGHGGGEGVMMAVRNAVLIGLIGLTIWLFIRHKKRHIHNQAP